MTSESGSEISLQNLLENGPTAVETDSEKHQKLADQSQNSQTSVQPPDLHAQNSEDPTQKVPTNLIPNDILGNAAKYSVQVITKYMCRYCALQFDSPTEMQAHIQNHIKGKAPHACSVCGKEYRTPSKLQRHVRVHSGERPYSCNICGRRFTRSDHVKQHMKVHMPQKQRNECRLCGTKFMKATTLHQHLEQSHNIKNVFTCRRCGEAFELLDELHSHKETHVKIEVIEPGGVSIKQEPNTEAQNNVVGLAKFNLGPQPQVHETLTSGTTMSSMDSIFSAFTNMNSNGVSASQVDMGIGQREEFSLIPVNGVIDTSLGDQIEQATKMAISAAFSLTGNGEGSNMETEEFEDLKKSTTVTDGTEMYILPENMPDGLKESSDGEEMETSSTDNADSSRNESFNSSAEIRDENMESKDTDGKDESANMDAESDKDPKTGNLVNGSTEDNQSATLADSATKINEHANALGLMPTNPTSILPLRMVQPVRLGPASQQMVSLIKSAPTSQLVRARMKQKFIPFTGPKPVAPKPVTSGATAVSAPTSTTTMAQVPAILQPKSATSSLSLLPNLTLIASTQGGLVSYPVTAAVTLPTATATATATVSNASVPIIASASSKPTLNYVYKPAAPHADNVNSVRTTFPGRPVSYMGKQMYRCEHCCMWFEDQAMSLLHNSLHSADDADPFTCKKCMKKMGNRLEFTAHLVWHLEPNMF